MLIVEQTDIQVNEELLRQVAGTFYEMLPQYQGLFAPKNAQLFEQSPPGVSFIAEYLNPENQQLIESAVIGIFFYGSQAVDSEGNPGTQIETSVVADTMNGNPAKLNLKKLRLIDREFEEYVLFIPSYMEDATDSITQFAAQHLGALFDYLEDTAP